MPPDLSGPLKTQRSNKQEQANVGSASSDRNKFCAGIRQAPFFISLLDLVSRGAVAPCVLHNQPFSVCSNTPVIIFSSLRLLLRMILPRLIRES